MSFTTNTTTINSLKKLPTISRLFTHTLAITLVLAPAVTYCMHEPISLALTPEWQELKTTAEQQSSDETWVIAGRIRINKNSKEPLALDRLRLVWHGAPIPSLMGSLYHQKTDHECLAIEDNLLCDGTWHHKKKTLSLTFKKPLHIAPCTNLALTLSLAKKDVPTLKKGYFTIDSKSLPTQLQAYAKQHKLSLAFTAPGGKRATF